MTESPKEEALRLARKTGLSVNDYGQVYATGSGAVLWEDLVRLIALARASQAQPPAEPKTILERAYEPVKATKPPAPPNWKEPAEPPAAPVQQEQCVCNEIGLAGVSECLKHPVQQEPDWIECLRRLGRRAERAEAERDALKAELAGQAWTMRDMEDQLAALRAQASPEAPDDMRAFAKAAQAIALERAAKVCENYEHISELDNPGSWCAAAIRALISEVRK